MSVGASSALEAKQNAEVATRARRKAKGGVIARFGKKTTTEDTDEQREDFHECRDVEFTPPRTTKTPVAWG
jgi:hypothetical protein